MNSRVARIVGFTLLFTAGIAVIIVSVIPSVIPTGDPKASSANPQAQGESGKPVTSSSESSESGAGLPEPNPGSEPSVPQAEGGTDVGTQASDTGMVVETLSGLSGDPHIATFDGMVVTYLDSGDYLLARSTNKRMPIMYQGRFCRRGGQEGSSTCALALKCGADADLAEIYTDKKNVRVFFNGEEEKLLKKPGEVSGNRVQVVRRKRDIRVLCDNGFEVTAYIRRSAKEYYLDSKVYVPGDLHRQVEGLLGRFDGDFENDVMYRTGEVWNPGHGLDYANAIDFPELDKVQASWMLKGDEGIFTFPCSMDKDSECAPVSRRTMLADKFSKSTQLVEQAGRLCSESGLTGVQHKMCVFDMVATEDEEYVKNAVDWKNTWHAARQDRRC